jgi:serine/threonine protein phosphatase PrpC
MEDAHISSLDIGDGVAIFGVFDGHGGKQFLL